MIRTRFAPSPTGFLHCGNVRTALFNTLMAANSHGEVILRIEDTDQARSSAELTHALTNDLKWLGLHWHEGPYFQSERLPLYSKYFQELHDKNLTYPCFCSDETIKVVHKLQLSRGEPPRYPGTCTALTPKEIEKRLTEGHKPAWRFRVPHAQHVGFDDLVRGHQNFESDSIGDFIIRRADGTSPFLFSNAIDDAEMGVTHVLRGEDHVANTPRQILILKALSLPSLHYGHLPLIVGSNGTPLSKRDGSFSIHDLRLKGYLPIAILNYLARLGCTFESNALMPLQVLADAFQPARIGRSPSHFDPDHLLHWQKQAVMSLTTLELQHWLASVFPTDMHVEDRDKFLILMQQNIVFPDEALAWAHIFWGGSLHYTKEQRACFIETGRTFFETLKVATQSESLPMACKTAGNHCHLSGKKLYLPVRLALTGRSDGPELAQIAAMMGVDRMVSRINDLITDLT